MEQNKQPYFDKLKSQSASWRINIKFIIPIILVIILIIISIVVTISSKKNQSEQTFDINAQSVEVVNSENNLPNNSAKPETNNTPDSVQSSPATVQDLGGNNSAPQDIDTLLKDKSIEVK